MINRRYSASLDKSSNGNNGSATGIFSSSPQYLLYNRSISQPSPTTSLPKAIPMGRTSRSKSVFTQNGHLEGNLPPSSAPVTFNRYINVNQSAAAAAATTEQTSSSPSSSWYARLSSSLKKSVLRRSISNRETTLRRRGAGGGGAGGGFGGGPRRSVIRL